MQLKGTLGGDHIVLASAPGPDKSFRVKKKTNILHLLQIPTYSSTRSRCRAPPSERKSGKTIYIGERGFPKESSLGHREHQAAELLVQLMLDVYLDEIFSDGEIVCCNEHRTHQVSALVRY